MLAFIGESWSSSCCARAHCFPLLIAFIHSPIERLSGQVADRFFASTNNVCNECFCACGQSGACFLFPSSLDQVCTSVHSAVSGLHQRGHLARFPDGLSPRRNVQDPWEGVKADSAVCHLDISFSGSSRTAQLAQPQRTLAEF